MKSDIEVVPYQRAISNEDMEEDEAGDVPETTKQTNNTLKEVPAMRQRVARNSILIFHQLANSKEKRDLASSNFLQFMTLSAEKSSMAQHVIDFILKIEKMQQSFRGVLQANAGRRAACIEIIEHVIILNVEREKELQAQLETKPKANVKGKSNKSAIEKQDKESKERVLAFKEIQIQFMPVLAQSVEWLNQMLSKMNLVNLMLNNCDSDQTKEKLKVSVTSLGYQFDHLSDLLFEHKPLKDKLLNHAMTESQHIKMLKFFSIELYEQMLKKQLIKESLQKLVSYVENENA